MVNFSNALNNIAGAKVNSTEISRITNGINSNSDFSNLTDKLVNIDKIERDALVAAKEKIGKSQEFISSATELGKNPLTRTSKLNSPLTDKPTPVTDKISNLDQPTVDTDPTANILHNFASYTYSISLHAIPMQKYNEIITGKTHYHTSDNTVLIASGGRNNNDFSRNKNFIEDFYFDELKMTTVVGLNSRSRNTNAIDLNFTLIEPYGFTFINRLLKVAAEAGAKTWFDLPFMIQLEFFGNNDIGDIVHPIPGTTKRIPIKIIGCKSKVSGKGSEYQIQAVPYTHTAFTESMASTPAALKVQATTLKDFFSLSQSAGEAANITKFQTAGKERQEQISKEIEAERKNNANSTRVAELEKQKSSIGQDISNTGFLVYSYAAALESYQLQLKESKNIMYPDRYSFVFENTEEAKKMANSKIVFPKKTEIKTTPMVSINSPGGIAAIRAQAGLPVAGPDANTEVFSVNAGTSIIEVIDQAIRSSEYIRNQFPDPSTQIPANADGQFLADKFQKPIHWYKIVPVVELQKFDENLNRYSKKITYHIKTYTYYNSKFRDAPKAIPTSYSKRYNYMYTGLNKDVIDFSIDFDTMFYTAITADKSKSQTVKIQQQHQEKTDAGVDAITHVKVQTAVTHPVAGQASMPDPASVDNKSILINDFAAAAMSGSRGDMINVKLKIIGDPQLIKQDDIMYNPANSVARVSGTIDPVSNSVVYDAGEVFALLEFKTPTDYNETTGLMNFDNAEVSVFSGLYKIITVENEFRQGMFTQTLDLIRLFDQPAYDTVDGSKIQNNQRDAEPSTIAEQKWAAERARTEFAKTDPRRIDIENIEKAAKARAEFAEIDPRRINSEKAAAKARVDLNEKLPKTR